MGSAIRIAILANGRQARGEIRGVANEAGLMGRALSRVGGTLVAGFAIDRLVRGAAAVVHTGGDYVETLSKIQAITKANNTELDKGGTFLESQASLYAKMGQNVGDAADGTLELAKSGLSLNASLKAVYPTMVLAKSGQLEVADASTLVANTLNTFHLKAGQAVDIANSLANAADISSADVSDLAESFKYVSPLAAKAGISLDQTNAVLAELSNSGVKASQAGTSLRAFLLGLQAPSAAGSKALKQIGVDVYDTTGKMKPLRTVIGELQGGLDKLDQHEQNVVLKALFGRTGVTGAQIILKGGVDALDTYTKGVQAAGGAARLANATSKGLQGTLRSLWSQAVSTSDALYRKYSPAVDSALQKVIVAAKQRLPDAINSAKHVASELEPLLKSLADLAVDLGHDLGEVATGPMGQVFVGGLKLVIGAAKPVADILDAIPAPVRQIGIEAAIAAAILPKLAAGVAATVPPLVASAAELKLWSAAALNAETRSTALGIAALKIAPAAKQAAGIGGMLTLVDSTQQTSRAMGSLEGAAGGALLGFSLGGPIGAAIGAGAGGLLGLWQATKKSSDAFTDAKPPAEDYASSLDRVTGATTTATRAAIQHALSLSDAAGFLGSFGLSQRTVVSAVLGNKTAIEQVNAAIANGQQLVVHYTDQWGAQYTSGVKNEKQLDKLTASLVAQGFTIDDVAKSQADLAGSKEILGFIGEQTNAWRDASRSTKAQILASQDLSAVYKNFPKAVATKIGATGIPPTIAGIARVAAKYGTIDKKHIRALITATGTDFTVKQVQKVIHQLEAAGKIKVKAPDIAGPVNQAAGKAKGAADRGGRDIQDQLERHLAKTKANMPQLSPSVRSATGEAAGVGRTGAAGIGSAVKSGFGGGFAGAILSWSAQVRSAVHAAIAAGRAEARAHSPSEETRDLGHDLADGLVLGILERSGKTKGALASQIRQLLLGNHGADQIGDALDQLTKLIEKHVNLKDNKAEKARERAILDHLHKQYVAYRAIGRQQDALKDGNYLKYLKQGSALYQAMTAAGVKNLTEAREHLAALQTQAADYAATIRTTFVDFGNITNLGLEHVTTGGVLSALRARADQAEKYAALIDQLKAAGLNQTALQQLLDAGPEQGLATAQAIANGGTAAIGEINQLTTRFDQAGTKLGQVMSDSLYAAGIAGAQGLVAGLEQQENALAKVARKLARKLVQSVKDELGIKSPSRVMAGIMTDVQRGLGVGVDDIYVRRQGARIAKAVVTGFGTPALDSYLSGTGARQPIALSVKVTAEALHQLQRGRDVRADLDAWDGAGGATTVTVTP